MDEAKTIGCGSGGGVFVSDGPPPATPQLTLTLDVERLNQDRYNLGDEIVAELRLTNTGDRPIVLPWNPDDAIVYGKDCRDLHKPKPAGTLVGSIVVSFIDAAGHPQVQAGHELFGLLGTPSTYQKLLPQESARIRVGGKVYVANFMASSEPAHFQVVASFELRDSSLPDAYRTVTSINHQDVTLVR